MSRETVEIVRRALELLRASYASGAAEQGLLELCAPDVRIDASRRVFNPDVYEGREGVERSIRDTCEAWEDFHDTVERVIDAGERVALIQTIAGRGRASKALVQLEGAIVWTVRNGLIELVEVFVDADEALDALGPDATRA